MFVPKILAIFVAMLVALPFMADTMQGHMVRHRRAHRRRLGVRGQRARRRNMQIDVSFLPALAAAFLLVFARIGTMVMLLPGLGELNVSARVRLTFALVLTAVLLPLHRDAYQIDLRCARARCCVDAGRGNVDRRGARPDRAPDDLRAAGRGLGRSPSSSASASSPRSIRPRASRA